MGSISFSGGGADLGQHVAVYHYGAVGLAVDTPFYIAAVSSTILSIVCRVEVAGTDVGAVTGQVRKVASGTALASGTLLHSGTFNLKGTAATNQTLTLSTTPSDLSIPIGSAIAFDLTGVATAANGCIVVTLQGWA
jgi:hypothetical protein